MSHERDEALQLPAMREQLLAGLRVDADRLPCHIRQSWERCRQLPLHGIEAAPLGRAELDERRAQADRLLACALPELDALTEHATGNGCVVVLSDASGLILEEIGSPEFLPRAERVALMPGVDWSEPLRGTNAIGTALAACEPVLVLGAEHYLPQNAALGCAAAPIFAGAGAVAGVLDMSGEAPRVNRHALGLVRMAAQQIEHRLMLADARGHLLRFHRRPGLIGSPREALIAAEDGRIVAANRVALALLGRSWSGVLGQPVETWLGKSWQVGGGGDRLARSPHGDELAVRVERLASVTNRARSASIDRSSAVRKTLDALQPLLGEAVKVLNHGVTVLIAGETGSGKEVFARRLHRASRRASGPFVAVNCAALPETLIEAELFGYEEGAFTGARRRGAPGRVREADGGILFLDEIADMPLLLQTRLLRVLEDHKVTPLGGGQAAAVDFQLVCATHGNLPALAAKGAFRSDLLYRVAGFTVHLPPLRDRADRFDLVAKIFDEAGGASKRLQLSQPALDLLTAHRWPGNVRELASVLRSIVALADEGETIAAAQVAAQIQVVVQAQPSPKVELMSLPAHLAEMEHVAFERALQASGKNVAAAARRLGVHRSTVYRYLARRDAARACPPVAGSPS